MAESFPESRKSRMSPNRPAIRRSHSRLFSLLTSRYLLVPLVLLFFAGGVVLTYYYYRYTALIDAGLRGDIFVRSSGIYAAPPELRAGSSMKMNAVIAHLKRIGYIEGKGGQQERRGQYAIRGATVEIKPGAEADANATAEFRQLRVSFGRGGDGIQSLSDITTRQELERAQLEPELISSVINQEREKRKI